MKFITYATSTHEISTLFDLGLREVILSNKKLSRFSKNNELNELASFAKKLEMKVVLEWDILLTESDFSESVQAFLEILPENYDVVRVQDVGLLEYTLTETNKQIQFITESGNHNFIGLQKWVSYIGSRLDRLVLSIELNKEKLENYCGKLGCETELLVLGRVLLFYSPRKLLSPMDDENSEEKRNTQNLSNEFLEAIGESEESPHKGFPLVENRHGTFMFHIKDLFLLDKYQDLKEIGLTHLRVDLRHRSEPDLMREVLQKSSINDGFKNLKDLYGKDVIRGYFQINKSDVLFKKLKNYRILRKGSSYLGEVVEIVKGEYLAINIKNDNSLSVDDELLFVTPEGKELICRVHFLKDVTYNEIDKKGKGEIALMNYMGGVWPKSQVYLNAAYQKENAQGESSLRN